MKRIKAEVIRAKTVAQNLKCNQDLKKKVKQKEATKEVKTKDLGAVVILRKVIMIEKAEVKAKEGAEVDEEIEAEGAQRAQGKEDQGPGLVDGREVDQTGSHLADLDPTRNH